MCAPAATRDVVLERVDRADTLRALVETYNRLDAATITVERMRAMRAAMGRSDVLARVDGRPVGYGLVGLFPGMAPGAQAAARFAVEPGSQRLGVGTRIHDWLLDEARAMGKALLEVQPPASDAESVAWLRRRGYRVVERLFSLRLDLAGARLDGDPTAAAGLVTLAERPDLVRELFAVWAETAADVPGTVGEQVPSDFDEWAAFELDPETRPPELTLLALVDGEPAGMARLIRRDDATVFHAHTGVRRPFRGRGLARSLKLAQLRAARAAGYRFAVTDNHSDNAAIARLNERLGYEPFDVKLTLVGPG